MFAPWFAKRAIATRLFLSALVLSFTILAIAGFVLSALYRRAAEAAFDDRLGVYLRSLVGDIANSGDENRSDVGQLNDPNFELILSGWYWQITRIDTERQTIRSSRSLFAGRLPRLSDAGVEIGPGGARRGYARGPDDRPLRIVERVVDLGEGGTYLIQVAASTEDLDGQVARFEFALAVTFAILALALTGSSVLQLRYGLRPLRRLQEGVAAVRRGEGDHIDGVFTVDVAPLAGELNLLLAANREVVERARTQVGNLAHALKTPLSVIINETAPDTVGGVEKVKEQAAIMRDQVAYYLDRARVAVRAGKVGNATEVAPVVDGLLRTFEKIYADRAIVFVADVAPGLRFQGERQDLEELFGNLIDNAGKWAKGAVAVTVAPLPGDPALQRPAFAAMVDDDGPGLPAELRDAAMQRGRRLDETKPGSGLGLSIVVDLAAMYGGGLTLDVSPAAGLRAVLRLPAA